MDYISTFNIEKDNYIIYWDIPLLKLNDTLKDINNSPLLLLYFIYPSYNVL